MVKGCEDQAKGFIHSPQGLGRQCGVLSRAVIQISVIERSLSVWLVWRVVWGEGGRLEEETWEDVGVVVKSGDAEA